MYKILIIIFIIGISFPYSSYAAGVCQIKDKSAQALLDYIKDNRLVVENVTKTISESKIEKIEYEKKDTDSFLGNQAESIKKDAIDTYNRTMEKLSIAGSETMTLFNELINFTGYYSYFNYYVTYPIYNEVPYPAIRDYNIINNEGKGLLEYIKKIDSNNQTGIIINNACEGISEAAKESCNTNLNGKDSKEIIGKLLQNNDKMLDYFRLTIMGVPGGFSGKKIILVGSNFNRKIKNNYGINALNSCKTNGPGFFKQITTSIKNIELLNEQGSEGIEKWKSAFKLLIGGNPNEEGKIAERELKKYLSESGIQTDNKNITLSNLLRYNSEGISLSNNFLSNTFSSILGKIQDKVEIWQKQTFGHLFEKKGNRKNFSIGKIQEDDDDLKITENIESRIANLYESQIPFASISDVTGGKLRAKIIDTHLKIDDSINILSNSTCQNAVATCNAQGGGGNCGSCN